VKRRIRVDDRQPNPEELRMKTLRRSLFALALSVVAAGCSSSPILAPDGDYQPGTGSYQPGTGSYQPGTGSYQPGTGSYQPGTGSYQPGTGSYQPGTGS
jgi:hypothetical protein